MKDDAGPVILLLANHAFTTVSGVERLSPVDREKLTAGDLYLRVALAVRQPCSGASETAGSVAPELRSGRRRDSFFCRLLESVGDAEEARFAAGRADETDSEGRGQRLESGGPGFAARKCFGTIAYGTTSSG